MDQGKLQAFKDRVWTTRVSRVNAEERLVRKELFFQGINIYYSCVTIIFSILTLKNHNDRLNLMTVLMTISLLIVILYLNGQKYLEHAREYRKNYTALHKLEFKLEHLTADDINEIKEIEQEYCNLMDSSSNHISYDYYCTVFESRGEYRENRWKDVKAKYIWGTCWRILIKILIVILPFVLFGVCGVI